MASEQLQQVERPITYGDAFDCQGSLRQQPITREDASLMQSVESTAAGAVIKGGAAAVMQSAADRNVAKGALPPDARSSVPEGGLQLEQTAKGSAIMHRESAAGQTVATTVAERTDMEYPAYPALTGDVQDSGVAGGKPLTRFTADRNGIIADRPDESALDVPRETQGRPAAYKPVTIAEAIDAAAAGAPQKQVTIGQAMEAAAAGVSDTPVEDSDAGAIQSAEARAVGPFAGPDSIGATAQTAAAANSQFGTPDTFISMADVLSDTRSRLPADKAVTDADAVKVSDVERRQRSDGEEREGGVADQMLAAADVNTGTAP